MVTWKVFDAGYTLDKAMTDFGVLEESVVQFLDRYPVDGLMDVGIRNQFTVTEAFGKEVWKKTFAEYMKCIKYILHMSSVTGKGYGLSSLSPNNPMMGANALNIEELFSNLLGYADSYKAVFQDESAWGAFAGSFSQYHGLLRSQLAVPLRRFCPSDFAAQYAAEALLTWTVAGKEFREIWRLLGPIANTKIKE